MTPTGLYRFTSIARPIDPKYPTNRLVLILVPLATVAAVLVNLLVLKGDTVSLALSVALGMVGTWALTRELAPDDNAAAFIAMLLAFAALLVVGPMSVVPLFVTLFLVRIVNRTTGSPPRLFDSISISGLAIWASGQLGDPLIALAATIAFYLDASLARPARYQLLFGTLCLGASMFFIVRDGVSMPAMAELTGLPFWASVIVLGAYGVATFSPQKLLSVGDIDELPLNVPRVRAGMFIAGLMAAQAPVIAGETTMNLLPWCAMAGVVAGGLTRGRDAMAR